MRLLPLIVLSLAVFGCFATAEEEDSIDPAMATKLVFTIFELSFADDIDKMGTNMPKRQLKKFSHEVFAVLKKTVPRGSQPTDAELKTMAGKVAQAARAAGDGFRSKNNITSEILKIVTNTEELTKAPGPVSEEQPSPSVFANGVKKIGGKYSNNSYVIAAFSRCLFDKMKLKPVSNSSSTDSNWKLYEECDQKFGLGELDLTDLLIPEMLETFSSERNSEVLIRGFSILLRALRDQASYESVDAFIENVKESKRLKAIGVLYKESKRCLPVEYDEMIDSSLNNLAPLMMEALVEGDVPSDEKMQKALAGFNAEGQKYNQSMLLSLKQNALEMERNFSECILPEEALERLSKIKMALNGVEEDEAKSLEEVKSINIFAHAVVEILYAHLKALRSRVGTNHEANEFITKVSTIMDTWSETDGTTEAGKAATTKLIEELRNSFIHLPRDAKKVIVDHFPIRSAAILGAVF